MTDYLYKEKRDIAVSFKAGEAGRVGFEPTRDFSVGFGDQCHRPLGDRPIYFIKYLNSFLDDLILI